MYPGFPGRTVNVVVDRVRQDGREDVSDVVAAEEPLEIRVGHAGETMTNVSITMRTPGNDFELAIGFLFGEGLIHQAADIAETRYAEDALPERQFNVVEVALGSTVALDLDRLARNFYTTSSCGVCGKASIDALYFQSTSQRIGTGFSVPGEMLRTLPPILRGAQDVFASTGGLHAAGLFDAEGNLRALREDVGRHNAVDKVIGQRVLAGEIPLDQSILLLSGRASFELVQKAVMAGIPIVAAIGAPSSLAVDAARDFGITLVGFLRRDGFNVYSHAERIR